MSKDDTIDALLADNELPSHAITASCRRLFVDIPWENLSSGDWTLNIDGLVVVVAPKEKEYWCLDDVRAVKEAAILKALKPLLRRLHERWAAARREAHLWPKGVAARATAQLARD